MKLKCFVRIVWIMGIGALPQGSWSQELPKNVLGRPLFCLQALDACDGTISTTITDRILKMSPIEESDPRVGQLALNCAHLVEARTGKMLEVFLLPSASEKKNAPARLVAYSIGSRQCIGKEFKLPKGKYQLALTGDRVWIQVGKNKVYFVTMDLRMEPMEDLFVKGLSDARAEESLKDGVPTSRFVDLYLGTAP